MTDDRHIHDALAATEDGLAAEQPPGPEWVGVVRHGLVARRRRHRAAAAGIAGLLVLGGGAIAYAATGGTDGGDNLIATEPTRTAETTPSPTRPPSAEPSDAPGPTAPPPSPTPALCRPAFPANTLRDTGSPSGLQLGMRSASAALQHDYDRVVFNLGGDGGEPGWRVEYVKDPRSDGSGDPVAVDGDATLQVVIENIGTPGDTGVPYPGPGDRRFSPRDTEVVEEVVLDAVFEGYFTAFIGTTAELAFRVFKLDDPARLVVDVRHC